MNVVVGRPYLPSGGRLIIQTATAAEYAPFESCHYLRGHATGTRCYLATHRGASAAWCSIIRQVGAAGWRVHRLVVLPEERGQGLARVLLTWVAESLDVPLSIRTRQTSFLDALVAAGDGWRPSRHGTHPTAADHRTGRGSTSAQSAVYDPEGVTTSAVCEVCGVTLSGRYSSARTCSGRCRTAAYRARRAA